MEKWWLIGMRVSFLLAVITFILGFLTSLGMPQFLLNLTSGGFNRVTQTLLLFTIAIYFIEKRTKK